MPTPRLKAADQNAYLVCSKLKQPFCESQPRRETIDVRVPDAGLCAAAPNRFFTAPIAAPMHRTPCATVVTLQQHKTPRSQHAHAVLKDEALIPEAASIRTTHSQHASDVMADDAASAASAAGSITSVAASRVPVSIPLDDRAAADAAMSAAFAQSLKAAFAVPPVASSNSSTSSGSSATKRKGGVVAAAEAERADEEHDDEDESDEADDDDDETYEPDTGSDVRSMKSAASAAAVASVSAATAAAPSRSRKKGSKQKSVGGASSASSSSSSAAAASFSAVAPVSKRRRTKIPASAVAVLSAWFQANVQHPYPTKEQQAQLMEEAQVDSTQFVNWFTNTRKRFWWNDPVDKSKNYLSAERIVPTGKSKQPARSKAKGRKRDSDEDEDE